MKKFGVRLSFCWAVLGRTLFAFFQNCSYSQIGKCNKWVHVDSVAWDEFLWFLPFYPNHITRWHHTFIPKAYLGQTPIWSSRMANIYLALQDDFITSLDLTTVLLLALFWLWPFTPCKGVFLVMIIYLLAH